MTLDGFEAKPERLHDPQLWLAVLKNVRAGHHAPGRQAAAVGRGAAAAGGLDQVRRVRDRPEGPRPGPRHRPPAQPGRVPQHDPRPDGRGLRHRRRVPARRHRPRLRQHRRRADALAPAAREVPRGGRTRSSPQAVPTRPEGRRRDRSIAGPSFRPPTAAENGAAQARCRSPTTSRRRSSATVRRSSTTASTGWSSTSRRTSGTSTASSTTTECRLVFQADGEELLAQEFGRQDGKPFRFEFDRDWKAGAARR